ncbi:MAG: hypothetical protein JWM40_1684, partial [Frankiales bacterium]|nr:hypothetical protein [Frankiales bacterium]
VARTTLSPRLLEVTLRTAALPTPTKVRVLLPAGYATGGRRYPVLYLFNGGGGSWLDWTTQGSAERLTAHTPVIVVMPDGGQGGNYVDWFGPDASGMRPLWETYHVGQLLPWIDRHFRTIATRAQRAVAGVSMGGNGALHYAARHPDLFVAAASFSGANDVFNPIFYPITETTEISNGATPGSVFGPRATEQIRWRASNPVDLAANLGSTWVSLSYGNGITSQGGLPVDPIEVAVHDCNVTLHKALAAAGVAHVVDAYGAGNHSWPYWTRDLALALPRLMSVFAENRPAPTTLTHYSSTSTRYDVFGWSVRLTRPVLETSYLQNADRYGFALRGSGSAVVTTPALYPPGKRLDVVVRDARGTRTLRIVVGHGGRLAVPVDLGAANSFQQDTAPALLTGTTVRDAHVTITP